MFKHVTPWEKNTVIEYWGKHFPPSACQSSIWKSQQRAQGKVHLDLPPSLLAAGRKEEHSQGEEPHKKNWSVAKLNTLGTLPKGPAAQKAEGISRSVLIR